LEGGFGDLLGDYPAYDCIGLAQWSKNHQPTSDGDFEREWVNAM
jgi:hypothetical protein